MLKKYKCCLCGKEYDTEKEVVVCVNRCGREKFSNGAFIKKDAPKRTEDKINVYSHSLYKDINEIREDFNLLLNELTTYFKKQPKPFIQQMLRNIEKDNKETVDKGELLLRYEQLCLIKKLYTKENQNVS